MDAALIFLSDLSFKLFLLVPGGAGGHNGFFSGSESLKGFQMDRVFLGFTPSAVAPDRDAAASLSISFPDNCERLSPLGEEPEVIPARRERLGLSTAVGLAAVDGGGDEGAEEGGELPCLPSSWP